MSKLFQGGLYSSQHLLHVPNVNGNKGTPTACGGLVPGQSVSVQALHTTPTLWTILEESSNSLCAHLVRSSPQGIAAPIAPKFSVIVNSWPCMVDMM